MSFGIGASSSSLRGLRNMEPLMNFLSPTPLLFQGSNEVHKESGECEYLPLERRYLGKASGGSPSLFLLQGWFSPGLLPRSLLTLQPLCFPVNCGCLNGGKCVTYKYFSNIQRCSCPKKFQGEHCEIGMGVLTLTGRGQGYQ